MDKENRRKAGERKLRLSRETLRLLDEPELRNIHGGASMGATGPCFTCPQCLVTLDDC